MHVTIHKNIVPYSKQCLHWLQISCHSQSVTHQRLSLLRPTSRRH